MIVGVPKETCPGERRVALVPGAVSALIKAGVEVRIEPGAGQTAGFPDREYADKQAKIAASREELFAQCEVILQVRCPGSNPEAGQADLDRMRAEQVVVGCWDPLSEAKRAQAAGERGVTAFALEMIPRITRAQSMDVLSSMATIAGYKAVLIAAGHLPRLFPMMMTAAGTLAPAHVFIVGAGVAGLQAIATARRLGAVVEAYDVRSDVKEQIESLGAKFVKMALEGPDAEGTGGYAKAMDEGFYRRQREFMGKVVAGNDVVITTAAVPGKKAPVLINADMVKGMKPGSLIVDLAAERGGNCELTRPGEIVDVDGVMIHGPVNLPATVPYHASQMYARNISTFLLHLIKDGKLEIDMDDEITRDTLVTRGGNVVHTRVREVLGMTTEEATSGSTT